MDKWKENHYPNRTKKETQTWKNKNKSEYSQLRNLINEQAKKDQEEWLGQYCEEIWNQLYRGNTENSYKRIKMDFGKIKLKRKNIIIET